MSFTRALYYPYIDIQDEVWLKNAILYWNEIQTIVPSSIETPYSTKTGMMLYDEGILKPFHVNPDMPIINELTDDVLEYIDSPEGAEIFMSKEISNYHVIHYDKLPHEIRNLAHIHPAKLPDEIAHKIRSDFFGDRDRISVDSRFVDFYMTLLATRISEQTRAGLLTDTSANYKLSTAARADARLSAIPRHQRHYYDYYDRNTTINLAQGVLSDLIFERIQIDRDTPIENILDFRTDHMNDLGRFRTKIAELTSSVSNDQPFEAFKQQVEDIYINEVIPAVDCLKQDLDDSRIRWFTENFLKISFFSTGATSIPLTLLGLSAPYALLSGAAISLTAAAIQYNREKEATLRRNPFSYVLVAERTFPH